MGLEVMNYIIKLDLTILEVASIMMQPNEWLFSPEWRVCGQLTGRVSSTMQIVAPKRKKNYLQSVAVQQNAHWIS